MKKKVVITGATGMVGSLVLNHSLADPEITEVVSFVRRKSGVEHPKLNEIILKDFKDLSGQEDTLSDIDAVFYCQGVYTGAVSAEMFREITVDYPVELGKALLNHNSQPIFCLLSGAGADRNEKSRMQFARDKGAAENQLAALGFKQFVSFRPGYIYPVEPRKEPNFMYRLSRWLYPVVRLFGKNASIKSTELAGAIFKTGINGASQDILENREILRVLESK